MPLSCIRTWCGTGFTRRAGGSEHPVGGDAAAAVGGASTPYMIGQSDFIKLFISHRRYSARVKIADAFPLWARLNRGALNWEELSKRLQTEGETMTEAELQKCLGTLVGDEDLPVSMSHLDFADKVLGFQDYAEEDEDQPVEVEVNFHAVGRVDHIHDMMPLHTPFIYKSVSAICILEDRYACYATSTSYRYRT